MQSVFIAPATVLFQLKPVRIIPLILGCRIVSALAFRASKSNYHTHALAPRSKIDDKIYHLTSCLSIVKNSCHPYNLPSESAFY